MWSDNETTQDLLGYQVHADLLKKIILNDAMLPISIGVFGNWVLGAVKLFVNVKKTAFVIGADDTVQNFV